MDEMGDAQSLMAALENLKIAQMCVGNCQSWGQCNRPGLGKGGKPGSGVGTWADDDNSGWIQYPELTDRWDNSGLKRPDQDARGQTDRGDGQLSDALVPTKVKGQITPGGPMPSITLKGVSIKGQSKVAYEEAATAAQSEAQSALTKQRPRGPVRLRRASTSLIYWNKVETLQGFKFKPLKRPQPGEKTCYKRIKNKLKKSTEQQIQSFRDTYAALRAEIGKVIVGHTAIVEGTLIALFGGGHVLLEGVPGLGKTLLVRTLGEVLDLPFNRIQFTPDLMPADILGTNHRHGNRRGPARVSSSSAARSSRT